MLYQVENRGAVEIPESLVHQTTSVAEFFSLIHDSASAQGVVIGESDRFELPDHLVRRVDDWDSDSDCHPQPGTPGRSDRRNFLGRLGAGAAVLGGALLFGGKPKNASAQVDCRGCPDGNCTQFDGCFDGYGQYRRKTCNNRYTGGCGGQTCRVWGVRCNAW